MIKIVNGIKIITGKSQRMIWMGKTHTATIEGTTKSKTWTKQEVEEFSGAKQAEDRSKELGLNTSDRGNENTRAQFLPLQVSGSPFVQLI
jgi:hypothetical protein